MRKAKLSRAKIVVTAIRLIEEVGLESLSMRKIAAELGVEAMSLYRYVANKSDLLDAIHEAILGEMELPETSGDWKLDLENLAKAFRETLKGHPKAVSLFATRPAAASGSLELVDRALQILDSAGFRAAEQISILNGLVAFIVGHVMAETGDNEPRKDPFGEANLGELPHIARALKDPVQHDRDREFDFVLNAFIKGLVAAPS